MDDSTSSNKKKLFIILGLFLLFIVLAIFITTRSQSRKIVLGGEYVAPDSEAFMVYQDTTYLPTGIPDSDNMLRADIAYFARKKFTNIYDPKKQPSVVFNIQNKPIKKGFTYQFSGKYEEIKDEIRVSMTVLKNDRIRTSITDKKTGANIDNQLPSYSIRNQYISTLPINAKDYSIDYLSYDDYFMITLYDKSSRDSALNTLRTNLKIDTLKNEKYRVIVPASADEGSPPG